MKYADTQMCAQAVILAAGRGGRMGDLTSETPKPLLRVGGKTLIEHKLAALPKTVSEIILIVGYFEDKIRATVDGSYGGIPISYVEQEVPDGTALALRRAKDMLHGSFLVLNGDDLYVQEDLDAVAAAKEWSMLVSRSEDTSNVARVVSDEHGRITDILESGTHDGQPGYVNAGAYRLDERFFEYAPVPAKEGSEEMGLPQTIVSAARNIYIEQIAATRWCPINVPDDIACAEGMFPET